MAALVYLFLLCHQYSPFPFFTLVPSMLEHTLDCTLEGYSLSLFHDTVMWDVVELGTMRALGLGARNGVWGTAAGCEWQGARQALDIQADAEVK